MTAKLVYQANNTVGESIIWDSQNHRLLWVDIIGRTIYALDPDAGVHSSWSAPDLVTSIGLRKDGGAIVGLSKSVCLWDFNDHFELFAQVEPNLPDNRLNEGVVGPDGAFWIGTMQNNINPDGSPKNIAESTGKLYRCCTNNSVEQLTEDTFGITNTFVWADNQRFITADTLENALYSYAIDTQSQHLSGRKTIVSGFSCGLPDGSCLDAEGYIWNCRVVGGSCLIRFDPDGRIDRVVDLPCSWPTSCTFGGENLDTLYVTSARFTMENDYLKTAPQEGGLFALDVGVCGRNPMLFG